VFLYKKERKHILGTAYVRFVKRFDVLFSNVTDRMRSSFVSISTGLSARASINPKSHEIAMSRKRGKIMPKNKAKLLGYRSIRRLKSENEQFHHLLPVFAGER
jgi:hypothetical protein